MPLEIGGMGSTLVDQEHIYPNFGYVVTFFFFGCMYKGRDPPVLIWLHLLEEMTQISSLIMSRVSLNTSI